MSKLHSAFSQLDLSKKDKDNLIPGILGFVINGINTVEVSGRNGYVYVRLRDNLNEVVQAYNDAVSPAYGLAVLLYKDDVDKTRYRIHSRDVGRYQNWGSYSSYLPRHGSQHSFALDGTGGGDVVWVYGNQLMPLLGMPVTGSSGAMNVMVGEYNHYYDGVWQSAGNTGTADFTSYKPTDNTARMVLVYMDAAGNPKLRAGTSYFLESVTGSSAVIPHLPALQPDEFPIAGVRLVSGTSSITWDNIYDVRDHYGGWIKESGITGDEAFLLVTGSSSLANKRVITAGSGITLTDGGAGGNLIISATNTGSSGASLGEAYLVITGSSSLTNERVITAGADISLVDSGANSTFVIGVSTGTFSRANHSHAASSSAPTYPAIYDGAVFKGTGTAINFGDNLSVVMTGTTAFISSTFVDDSPNDLLIYDNGVFKVTGTAIDFGDNISVGVTGSVAYVSAVGATGTAGQAGAPGSNSLFLYDSSVFKATGTAISFDTGLSVATTGSTAYVSVASINGACYDNDNNTQWVAVSENTWTHLSGVGGWHDGTLNGVTHNSYGRLVAPVKGMYLVTYGVSIKGNSNGFHFKVGIHRGVSDDTGSILEPGQAHATAVAGYMLLCSSTIVEIEATQSVGLSFLVNGNATTTVTTDNANLAIVLLAPS